MRNVPLSRFSDFEEKAAILNCGRNTVSTVYMRCCVWCAVCTVCPVCVFFLCRKKAIENGVSCFDIFRNEKNALFTSHFSEVYYGPMTGGVFVFFQIEYPHFLRFTRVP
jgi:hypothetical protein